MNKKISPTDESIHRLAKIQRQLDVKQVEEIRKTCGDLNIRIRGTALEELASTPLEEYENSIKKRVSFSLNKEVCND